jgi:large subunit ribosomal protein L15
MKYNQLQTTKNPTRKRVGRGISAGGGKTAGRGTKGQNSRTGKKLRAGFEGGQNPLMARVPKLKGFKSKRSKAQIVYTGNLSHVGGNTISNQTLAYAGFISDAYHSVKIISRGDVSKAFNVKVQAASASAKAAIEKAGGTVEIAAVPQRTAAKTEAKS